MKPKTLTLKASSLVPVIGLIGAMAANASLVSTISVNFHVQGDGDAQADHELTGSESAGIDGNMNWNNVGIGGKQTNTAATIFTSTALSDDTGNTSAATLTSTLTTGATASWFVGYSASAASAEGELSNGISDDNLFNSYLGLNGPNGDGSPQDNFVLTISGLSSDFTTNGYNVIIYSDSDRRGTSNNARTSSFAITPSGDDPTASLFTEDDDINGNTYNIFSGSYIQGDQSEDGADYSNYVVFSGLDDDGFSIEVTSSDGGRGAISGFQIVAIPEPSTVGLVGLGLLGFGLRRRR